MTNQPIHTLVVGFGYAGQRLHVPLIRLASQLSLYGIVTSDPAKRDRIAHDPSCATFDRLESALADERVQLVVLATPNILHAPQALAAMRAGKHVIIDKPMCLSSSQANELLATARDSRLALGVFHNRRFDGDFLTLRHLLRTGALGDLRWLELSWQRPKMPRTWRLQASEGGGRLIDLGSHLIDQALQLFNSPVRSIYCRMHRDFEGLDIDSHAMLTLTFADGRTAIIDTSSMTFAPKPRILAMGTTGTFLKHGVDPQEDALIAGNIDAAVEPPANWGILHTADIHRPIEPIPGRWRSFYEQTGEALQNWPNAKLPAPAEEAARVIRVLEFAMQSADTGRAVAVDV